MSCCPDFNPRLQYGAFGVGFAGAHGPRPGSRTVAEHLNWDYTHGLYSQASKITYFRY